MNRKTKFRYLFLTYFSIGLIAVIVGVISYQLSDSFWQSLWLNVSTELFGVVLVFIFVNLLFIVDDWDLSEQVKELISRLQQSNKLFSVARTPGPEFEQLLQDAKEIHLLGIALNRFLPLYRNQVEKALYNGCSLKVILIAPNSDAVEMIAKRSKPSPSADVQRQQIEMSIVSIQQLQNECESGYVELRVIDFTPTFGITLINPSSQDRRNAYCYAYFYPFNSDTIPAIYPDKTHDQFWFEFISEQFDSIWKTAKPFKFEIEV